jgi:hypothetical protein
MFFKPRFVSLLAAIGMMTGLSTAAICGVWFLIDLGLVYVANAQVMQKARSVSPSQAQYLYSRELSHRLNLFAEGTWFLMGAMLTIQSARLGRDNQKN